MREKNMGISPDGTESKNISVDEIQQHILHFTGPEPRLNQRF
jgi:hypothetical protein